MIRTTLQRLGITCNYAGYKQLILAIELALEDEDRLCRITRQIYWVVADRTFSSRRNIERNFRTIIFRAWKNNLKLLTEIAKFPLHAPPSVSQFIAIMVAYIKREEKCFYADDPDG